MKKWILMAALFAAAGTGSVLHVQAADEPEPAIPAEQTPADSEEIPALPADDLSPPEPEADEAAPAEETVPTKGAAPSEETAPAEETVPGPEETAPAESEVRPAPVQSVQVSFTAVNASTGAAGKNSSFDKTVSSLQGKPVAFVHQGQGGTAGTAYEEASNFYSVIKNRIGQGILVLDCVKLDSSTGTVWLRDFLDFMSSFSGVRPLVNGASIGKWQNYDWSGIDTKQVTGTAFNGTAEQFQAAVKPSGSSPCFKEVMYRVYNPNSGEHFYTRSPQEQRYLTSLGWKDEGLSWMTKSTASLPVYRLYNPNAGDHHYTTNKGEKDYLVKVGWNDEGVGWYVDKDKTAPVWRAYNPNARTGTHHYTLNEAEYKYIVSLGWRAEGIAWYGIAPINNLKSGNYLVSGTYGFSKAGTPITGIQQVGSSLYYFTSSGTASKGGGCTKVADRKWIYINSDGTLASGEKQIGSTYKYFDKKTGLALLSQFIKIGGRICYFNGDGNRCTGRLTLNNAVFDLDPSNGNVRTCSVSGIPYLMQTDARWASRRVGLFNFGSTGCVPTVLTMAINAITGSSYTPDQIGQKLHDAGTFNVGFDVGTTGNGIVTAGKLFNVAVEVVSTSQQLIDALKTGGIVAAAMNPGTFCPNGITHEILAYGYDGGKTNVLDPYWSSHNGSYSCQSIWDQKSTDKLDCAAGGPIFCLRKKS